MSMVTISLHILLAITISCNNVATAADYSGLLSRLYNRATQNHKPLIIVVDRNNLQERNYPLKPSSLIDTSNESEKDVPLAVYLLQSQGSRVKNRKPPSYEKYYNMYNREQRYRHRNRLQRNKGNRDKMRYFATTPHSPVMKSFLRFKNDINCEANDECQDKCKEHFDGQNRDKCEDKCEEKFECEPEQEADDPCDNESDECGEKDDNTSTKGVILVTEKPGCVRC